MSKRILENPDNTLQPPQKRRKKGEKVKKWQCTKLFLTYPQNDIDKDILIKRTLDEYPDRVKWIVACNEDHEPKINEEGKASHGGIHAHMIIKLKKVTWNYHDVLDRIGGKHGKYETMGKSELSAMEYIIKHGNYSTWGFNDFEKHLGDLRSKRNPKNNQIVDLVEQGVTDIELLRNTELKGYAGFNLSKIKDIRAVFEKEQSDILNAPKYTLDENISPDINDLSRQLLDEITNQTTSRHHRQRHIYIGPHTGVGKSVLAKQLRRRFRVWTMGRTRLLEGERKNIYEDGKYDLILSDEFSIGHCSISALNEITGSNSQVDTTNRYVAVKKDDDLPVIILTNYTPPELWPNKVDSIAFKGFTTRWKFWEFTEDNPIRIWEDPEDVFKEGEDSYEVPEWVYSAPDPYLGHDHYQ